MASNITGTDLAEAIAELKTRFEALTVGNVLDRRRYVASKQDFVRLFGTTAVDGKKEIRFLEFEFLRFADDQTEGFDECPVANVDFNLHLFHEFNDLYAGGSNSSADFAASILRLRNYILLNREFDLTGTKRIVCDPIVQAEFAQFGADTFTDCKGHFTDLTLTVAFYEK